MPSMKDHRVYGPCRNLHLAFRLLHALRDYCHTATHRQDSCRDYQELAKSTLPCRGDTTCSPKETSYSYLPNNARQAFILWNYRGSWWCRSWRLLLPTGRLRRHLGGQIPSRARFSQR